MSALTEVLAKHVYPGEVNTALTHAWVDCSCGERVDVPVVHLSVNSHDVRDAFCAHVAKQIEQHIAAAIDEVDGLAAKSWAPVAVGRCLAVVRERLLGGAQ